MRSAARSTPAGLAVLALTGLALSGCISLFPKEKPAQLFRFAADTPAALAAGPPATAAVFTIRMAPISFESAAAGDRILTTAGDKVAYIAGSRWVTPADGQFAAAVQRAFDHHAGPARVLASGEPAISDYTLKVDVRQFETRYDHGPGAAPTVVVEAYGALVKRTDARDEKSRLFHAEARAGSNTVHAIAGAYDAAVGQILIALVGWADARGEG